MSGLVEKIKDIEAEIARTQINKQTMAHLCGLRAKLAKYKRDLLIGDSKARSRPPCALAASPRPLTARPHAGRAAAAVAAMASTSRRRATRE